MRDFRKFSYLVIIVILLISAGCDLFVGSPGKLDTNIKSKNINSVIKEGLKAWRKRGAIMEGAACANCHSPDALDLAYFDFDKKAIRRRALPHLGHQLSYQDIGKIIKLVKAQRKKYHIDPADPMKKRPLQPGGEVLPGDTPAERDKAFGEYLKKQGYRFANVPVLSEEEALKQRNEWLKLNPRKIKIGIPFNRWSEDPFHGSRHTTVADWLPDLPRVPKKGKSDEWYGLQDQYLQNPTDRNFWHMYSYIKDFTKPIMDSKSNRFYYEKYQAVLLAQHIFRKELIKDKPLYKWKTTAFMPDNGMQTDNPVWDVGALAHVLRHGDLRGREFHFPDKVRERNNLVKEMKRMRVPWFYAGWLLDQGLQHSGEGKVTETGRYFMLHMHIDDSYPIHEIFVISRKLIVQNFDTKTQDVSKPLVVDYADFNNWNYAYKYEPTDPEARKIYRLMTENSYRMMLLLMKKEIRENGIPTDNEYIVDTWHETISDFAKYVDQVKSDHYRYNLELIKEVRSALQEAE